MKKLLSLVMALCMVLGMASFAAAEDTLPTFDQIVLGENTDLTAKIHFAYHRTDIPDKLNGYVEEFRKTYPNIEIEYELITDYAENALLRVDNTDWTIMGIPTVQKDELSKYFVPLGDLETLGGLYNFMSSQSFEGVCYGIPSTGNANGVLYNKRIFAEAGVTELPKTPGPEGREGKDRRDPAVHQLRCRLDHGRLGRLHGRCGYRPCHLHEPGTGPHEGSLRGPGQRNRPLRRVQDPV